MSKIKNKIKSKEGFADYMKWSMCSYLLGVLVIISMILMIITSGIVSLILALIMFGFIYYAYKAIANAYWALLKHREHTGGRLRVLKLLKAKLLNAVAAIIVWLPILLVINLFTIGTIFKIFMQIYSIVFGLIIAINTEARCLYTSKTSVFATPSRIKEILSKIGNEIILKYFGILIISYILGGVLGFGLVILAFSISLPFVLLLAFLLFGLIMVCYVYARGLLFIASEEVFKK